MEAVGLGGRGGLDGKYVKNNRKQYTDHPNSVKRKYRYHIRHDTKIRTQSVLHGLFELYIVLISFAVDLVV